jgi:cytochrome c-type biogenesis protein CcmE
VKKQRQFMVVGALMVGVVGYLFVTGMKDSAMYYYTPDELLAAVHQDPSRHELGFKVGGRVVPGSVRFDQRTLDLRFEVVDIASGRGRFAVHHQGPLPDTFQEGRDVVIEGKYGREGTFEASTVLTKCGSRYEAAESELRRT